MPELHYRDQNSAQYLPMAGQQFSQAATALQRLKLMQLQQQREDQYRNAELGMRQREFMTKDAEAQEKLTEQKERRNHASAFSDAVKALWEPKGGLSKDEQGPPSPDYERQKHVQNAHTALAYILAESDPSGARLDLTEKQFKPGEPVYSGTSLMRQDGQQPQPLMTPPMLPMNDYQRQLLVQKKDIAARQMFQRMIQQKMQAAHQTRMDLERERHNKASKSENDGGLTEEERQRFMQGAGGQTKTNSISRFKITPLQ